MASISRRRLIGSAIGLAAGSASLSLLPPSLHRAMAAPMRPGGLQAVEHVILLMQENRSFDHYFGTLRGVRGFSDSTPLRLRNGAAVFAQPRSVISTAADAVLPFSLRQAAAQAGRPGTDIHYLDSLDHEWDGSTAAWARGWWDGWIPAKTAATMTYYERRDLPLQYELADAFTLCDAYHCSLFGGTNPNRNYFFTGTTGYEPGTDRRAVDNAAYDAAHPGYEWTTYPERLQAAGVSWQIYQEWDNFTDNPVEYFAPFKRLGTKLLSQVEGNYPTTEKFYEALRQKPPDEQRRLLSQLDAARERLSAPERDLFDRAMYRSEPDTLLRRVAADIEAGTLPKVSWLVPPAEFSEHPSSSTPVGSANLIYHVLDIVASDPETWSRTAIFLTFDENDGYFDHVASPVPPPGGEDWYDGRAIGLGPRVPMTVVSPWTIGGFVNSEVFDHTSVLRFLEQWTGVREPNISDWRRTVCGNMRSVFDFRTAGKPPTLRRPEKIPPPAARWTPLPPATPSMPEQERGSRPARPLPYQPSAAGSVSATGPTVRLINSGSASAHFTLYPFDGTADSPRHCDVRGEKTEAFRGEGPYDLVVQGPNRFWYEMRGHTGGAAAGLEVGTVPAGAEVRIALTNRGRRAITAVLTPLRYGGSSQEVEVAAGASRTVEWNTESGWYDVEVTAIEEPEFRRRITGRVENGGPGVSAD
ncbi:phosphocholine-specific phospholipase C [Nocardia blacklockiae]|uniref:phosphocholine-specific phospholipase C n=1 Tax=Nocardia blacklockiae TaxID=480036 RepID=UPI00189561FF|nr:phospholipase C, phosphocholine-specific [Nocardia blacklockiae]MBF6172535.1 phospholipase C, phosphocholine-specific [Nocardia blacklockiae]